MTDIFAANKILVIGKENFVDDVVGVYFFADGGGSSIEFTDEFSEVLPTIALGEDGVQSPEIIAILGMHHIQGDGGSLANSMPCDVPGTGGDVLQALCDGFTSSICCSCGSSCCDKEILDLSFQG